jgi:DNA-binding NarL/FixJ family response regulator
VTRVLVVEDSLTMRHHLRESLERDPDIEVVGEAADGLAAVELCARLRPDVVTMDIMLPGMNGLAATEHIMAEISAPQRKPSLGIVSLSPAGSAAGRGPSPTGEGRTWRDGREPSG